MAKTTEEDNEKQEAILNLAAAKEISVDAVLAVLLSELHDNCALKGELRMIQKAFLCWKDVFASLFGRDFSSTPQHITTFINRQGRPSQLTGSTKIEKRLVYLNLTDIRFKDARLKSTTVNYNSIENNNLAF